MRFRYWARQSGVRRLGILTVIFSLVHTPLPQPDYHNIRHHDGPGQVCAYHDHLLRWHPQAGAAEDVAVLHWHWFLPLSERPDLPARGEGPAWHAHVADWDPGVWDADPPRLASPTVRCAERPEPALGFALAPVTADAPTPALAAHPPQAFSATFAPGTSLASLLQRWAC